MKTALNLLAFLSVLAFATCTVILNGCVIAILWRWFVVPTFGMDPLSVAQAIGLALIVEFLTHQKIKSDDDDKTSAQKFTENLCYILGRPALTVLVGWIVTFFL